MARKKKCSERYRLAFLLFTISILFSCEYQIIYERDTLYDSAIIPVKLNWENTGFEIQDNGKTKNGDTYIHRVSFRFFPKNGGEPFERYIGDGYNVCNGNIMVPKGEYSVIVMNESVYDKYWEGSESGQANSIRFENIDDYMNFAATVETHSEVPSNYFWKKNDTTMYMKSPLMISSWSIDHFEVNQNLIDYTNKQIDTLSNSEIMMFKALTRDSVNDNNGIDMKKLTQRVRVKLVVENLASAQSIKGGISGFTNKVNMRTGAAYCEPDNKVMLQYFTFNGRKNWHNATGTYMGDNWQPAKGENKYKAYTGETSYTLTTFGRDVEREKRSSNPTQGLYHLDLSILYISGEQMDMENTVFELDLDNNPDTPNEACKIPIDITEQTTQSLSTNNTTRGVNIAYEVDLNINISTLKIEHTNGDISLDDWGPDEIIPL